MAQKSGNSKRPRRSPHSGRMRESTIKTGNRGARKSPLSDIDKILMGKGPLQKVKTRKKDDAAA